MTLTAPNPKPVPEPPPAAARRGVRSIALLLLGAVVVGAAFRALAAAKTSFWLDELHTIGHGFRRSLDATSDSVQRDFHVPLFYWAVQLAHRWVGFDVDVRAYRALTILAGLLALVPTGLLAARTSGGRRGVLLAVVVAACAPYQIHYSVEFRPYAWLLAASAAIAWAGLDDRGPAWFRGVVFFAATSLGALTQPLTALVVVAVGAARVATWGAYRKGPAFANDATRTWRPLPLKVLVPLGAAAGATLVPWVLTRMPWIKDSPGELAPDGPAPTMTSGMWREALQQPLTVIVPSLGGLGSPWREIATVGAALFAVGAGFAALVWGARLSASFLRRGAAPADATSARPSPQTFAVAVAAAFLVVVLTFVQIRMWRRFALRYDVVFAWAAPVLVAEILGAGADRLRRAAAALVVVGVFAMGFAEANGDSRENIAGAVRVAKEAGLLLELEDPEKKPVFSSLLWQSDFFESILPFRAFGRELDYRKPELLPRPGDPEFDRPVVVVTQRYWELADLPRADDQNPAIGGIRGGRRLAKKIKVDARCTVWIWVPA